MNECGKLDKEISSRDVSFFMRENRITLGRAPFVVIDGQQNYTGGGYGAFQLDTGADAVSFGPICVHWYGAAIQAQGQQQPGYEPCQTNEQPQRVSSQQTRLPMSD